MPTAAPITKQARADVNNRSRLVSGLSVGCLTLLAIGVVVAMRHRTGRPCGFGLSLNPDGGAPELPSNQQSLLQLENIATVPASVELVERSVMTKSYETSPAPVFVVGRDSMRITLWSPGMAIAAPTLRNPVGSLLSDLPFVKAGDQARLDQFLRRIFLAPAEHDHARTCMLHLRAKSSQVLLEVVATHFFVRDSEPIIVMTGRQIDSDLAVLLASETGSIIATSDANDDVLGDDVWGESPYLVSVSQAGSIKGDDDDNNLHVTSSVISSVTLPTLEEASRIGGSSVSSLTMPTMAPGYSISSLPMRTVQPVHPCPRGVRDLARIIDRTRMHLWRVLLRATRQPTLPSPTCSLSTAPTFGLVEMAVRINDAAAERSSANEDDPTTTRCPHGNEERAHAGNRVPLPWSAIGSSPALRFAIDREEQSRWDSDSDRTRISGVEATAAAAAAATRLIFRLGGAAAVAAEAEAEAEAASELAELEQLASGLAVVGATT